jgi:NADP-reducing hydrogenase subunit HndB
MSKLSLADLKKLREEKRKDMVKREEGKATQIIIGMGTCGIAAGAKEVFDAFLDEIDAKGLTDVAVTQTGCMGQCHVEPTVEVFAVDMPSIVYCNVKSDVAKRIVNEHLIDRKIIADHILDKPADILK